MKQLEDTLHLYLVKKAPFQLPTNVKEIIVKLAPWVNLIMMILVLPLVLFALGLGAVVAPFAMMSGAQYGMQYGANFGFAGIILAITVVLELLAIPGLFKRSKQGWTFLYWSTLVSFVASIVQYNIIGGIISAVIGLYFLFQIREYYK